MSDTTIRESKLTVGLDLGDRYCQVCQCLNTTEFWSIDHARVVVLESWRIEFNTEHLHSSLGYLTPEEFAASWSAA